MARYDSKVCWNEDGEIFEMKNGKVMNILYIIILLVILFLPKINIINVYGTYVGIRIEDFLVALFVILYIFKNKKNIFRIDNKSLKNTVVYFVFYILLCVISTISGIANKNIEISFGFLYLLRKVEYFLFIFMGYDFLQDNKNEKILFKLLDYSVIIHFIIILLQNIGIIGGILDGNYVTTKGGRLFSTFNGPYELSAFMTLLLPLYYKNLMDSKNDIKQIIKSTILILFIISSVYMSQSRTSLIVAIALLLFIPVFEKKQEIISFVKSNKIKSVVLCIITIIFIVTICNWLSNVNRFKTIDISLMIKTLKLSWQNKSFDRYQKEGGYIISEEDTDLSFSIRINKWMALIDGTMQKPIFGLGLSITKEACDGNYIRILAESGVLGFLAWLGLCINIFKSTRKKQNSLYYLANYGILVLLMTAIFIDIFEASKIMMLYWFIMGCAYSSDKLKIEKSEEITLVEKKDMNNSKTVAILMATYNGEKYIEEQIESILNQTYQDFVLYIRDDNSTDGTQRIINEYVKKYPEKIIQVRDDKIAKGACNNFMYLLEYVYNLNKYDMFMFSDQDDFWIEDKVKTTIKEYNRVNNKEQPILIHTDLNVVDAQLNVIDESFFKYSNLNGKYNSFNDYLIQNNVTGCTTFINKSLVDLIKFDIKEIRMHDWYFALIASAFGQVIFIDKATIKYRQHGNNVLGAKKIKGIIDIYNKLVKNNTIKEDLEKALRQAENFRENHYESLSEKNKKILDDFCKIKDSNKIKKIIIINKNNFYKQGVVRLIGEFIYI